MPRTLAKALITTATLAVLLAAPAAAHEIKKLAKKSSLIETAAFPVKRPALASSGVKKVYLGRAPYVCGPSGFGRRSKCFLRSGT